MNTTTSLYGEFAHYYKNRPVKAGLTLLYLQIQDKELSKAVETFASICKMVESLELPTNFAATNLAIKSEIIITPQMHTVIEELDALLIEEKSHFTPSAFTLETQNPQNIPDMLGAVCDKFLVKLNELKS